MPKDSTEKRDLEINKLRGGGFQWRISAHLIEPDEYSVIIQIRSKVDEYNKGKLFKQTIEALHRVAYELYEQYSGDRPKPMTVEELADELIEHGVPISFADNEVTTESESTIAPQVAGNVK